MVLKKLTDFLLELFFPKFCFNCRREEDYLCEDCQSLLDISGFHQAFSTENLKDLYFSLSYRNFLVKKIIHQFKYQPFIKELSKNLASLIIGHFQLLDNPPSFFGSDSDFVLIPVPLEKRRLKWRGFNQAEEIAKELSSFLKIPLISDCLIKTRETVPQIELAAETRRENIKGAFLIKNKDLLKNKKILLVDDVYTTGATMEECARILKTAGAEEIIGIVAARAVPGDDCLNI